MYDGDAGLEGLIVTLYDPNHVEIMTTVTNLDGSYSFENLPAGEYCIDYMADTGLYPNYTPDSTVPGYIDPNTGKGQKTKEKSIMKLHNIKLDPG